MPRGDGNILIDGAEIAFRNFAGRETEFNPAGNRNFCVLLDDALADQLRRDGWNVKALKPDRETGETQKYMQVGLKWRGREGKPVRPPEVYVITSRGKTQMDEESVEVIDYYDIANVDLIIRPYEYNFGGRSGVKAYLKSFYLTVAEDALALRYQNVPIAGENDLAAIETGLDGVIDVEWDESDDGPLELER